MVYVKLRNALTLLTTVLFSAHAAGNSFGIYDPRGMGMGGTGVTTGDLRTGHFYNPALLAFHRGDEDRLRNGQHSLTLVAGPLTDATEHAVDAVRDDYQGRLNDAIARYNQAPDSPANEDTLRAVTDLQDTLEAVNDRDIYGEGYFGYSVTVPSDAEGGAFFIGTRLIGGGTASISDDDIQLLNSYREAMQSSQPDETHPLLFGDDGQLINPNQSISSTAETQAIALVEAGVSVARRFFLRGRPFAVGVSPKIVTARTFQDEWRVLGGNFGNVGAVQDQLYANLDIGAAWELNEQFRVAVTGKDIFNKNFTTGIDHSMNLNGRYRGGISFRGNRFMVGMEMDLKPNESVFHNDIRRQDISLGGEFQPISGLALRLGYRQDVRNSFGNLTSAGVGIRSRFVTLDIAVTSGSEETGAALLIGIPN